MYFFKNYIKIYYSLFSYDHEVFKKKFKKYFPMKWQVSVNYHLIIQHYIGTGCRKSSYDGIAPLKHQGYEHSSVSYLH